jgi:hypothetical protein
MEIQSTEIVINGVVATVSGHTTRADFIELFGIPDYIGGYGRKQKRGKILKYGEMEFHFSGDTESDTLFFVYQEQLVVDEYVPEISIKFAVKIIYDPHKLKN